MHDRPRGPGAKIPHTPERPTVIFVAHRSGDTGGTNSNTSYNASTPATLTPAADEAGYVVGGAAMPAAGVTIARLAVD